MAEVATPENLQQAQAYVDFVKTNLEPLAQHLKVSVEWLWHILVKQAQVEAITLLILTTLLSLTTIVVLRLAVASYKRALEDMERVNVDRKAYECKTLDEYPTVVASTGALIALSVFSSINLSMSVPTIVTGLVNPEFRAIEKIVEYAKPASQAVRDGDV